jgi:tripartite-type tricarboxylate transporter receptor subunit TctC
MSAKNSCIAALLALACAGAAAQTSKPVRVIFPATAGSLLDTYLRAVVSQVAESTGQSMIVENRPGASAVIGMSACAKSPPDGTTVCTAIPDALTYNPLLFTNLPYDPDNDFMPVTNMTLVPGLLAARSDAPFKSLKELIAYAKANPGKINWGTWGAATIPEIYMNWIAHHAGVQITGIPYKGGGAAWPALLAGETQVTFIGLGFAMTQIKAGKAVPLVVTSPRRSKTYPNIPSLSEEVPDPGLADTWFGVFMPAKTQRTLIDSIHREFVRAVQSQKVQDFMAAQTMEGVGSSPQEFAEFLKGQRAAAARVFQTLGLKPNAGSF